MKWIEIGKDLDGNKLVGLQESDGVIRITASEEHPPYQEWLAWVEAGNDPDEFWTQTELTEMGEI